MKPGEKGGNSKSGGELASDANNSGGIIIFLPVKVLFTNQKREKLTVDKCINLNWNIKCPLKAIVLLIELEQKCAH